MLLKAAPLLFIWAKEKKKVGFDMLLMTRSLTMSSLLARHFLRRTTIPNKSSGWSLAGLTGPSLPRRRLFHNTLPRNVVKPYLLADIGEGIHMAKQFPAR